MKTYNIIIFLVSLVFISSPNSGHSQNLVQNGDFSAGNFTSWTFNNDPNTGVDQTHPLNPGGYDAYMGAAQPSYGQISQPLATVIGESYVVSFWYYISPPDYGNVIKNVTELSLQWGSNQIFDNTETGNQSSYMQFVVTEVAISSTTNLTFTGFNNNSYSFFTNVSVVQAPEPGTWISLGSLMGISLLLRKKALITFSSAE